MRLTQHIGYLIHYISAYFLYTFWFGCTMAFGFCVFSWCNNLSYNWTNPAMVTKCNPCISKMNLNITYYTVSYYIICYWIGTMYTYINTVQMTFRKENVKNIIWMIEASYREYVLMSRGCKYSKYKQDLADDISNWD